MNPLLDLLGGVGYVLDTPGSLLRGALSGRLGERASGREMLQSWGLVDPKAEGEDSWDTGDTAGLVGDLLLDPLNLLGGFGAVKAGKRLLGAKEAAQGLEEGAKVAGKVESPLAKAVGTFMKDESGTAHIPDPIAFLQGAKETAPAPTFYSRLEEAAKTLPEQTKAESLMNMLKKAPGGFSQEEAQWRKLPEYLEAKKALGETRINREDLLRHLDENKIDVKEVVKGGQGAQWQYKNGDTPDFIRLDLPGSDYHIHGNNDFGWEIRNRYGEPLPPHGPNTNRFSNLHHAQSVLAREVGDSTKWEQFATKGGKDYKEMLLTLPPTKMDKTAYDEIRGLIEKKNTQGFSRFSEAEAQRYKELLPQYENQARGFHNAYLSPHWDEPNVLAHVRYQDRIDPVTGKKVLHIDEIQSDWHQTGKKAGYKGKNPPGPTYEEMTSGPRHPDDFAVQPPVPDAPFKDAWHELAMKRMIKHAAENGYDKITWNAGDTVQALVGGEVTGQREFYNKVLPNWVQKYGKKYGVKVEPEIIREALPATASNTTAQAIANMPPAMRQALETHIGDTFGRSLPPGELSNFIRNRLLDMAESGPAEMAFGTGSEIASAVPGFHDYLSGYLPFKRSDAPAFGFNMTPELRKFALSGQPLLSLGGAAAASPLLMALLGGEQA